MDLASLGDSTGVVRELLLREATVGTAESLTGGQVAAAITTVPGSSGAFLGGVVAYATEVKVKVLGVPEQVVEEHGVISAECAESMATGVRELTGATYGIATTGVAGPSEQEGKPPGTVFVAVAGPRGVEVAALNPQGNRTQIQWASVEGVLSLLLGILRREEPAVG
ncbi:CinA family protein [Nocardioides gilvus]|uniref:CinA family protein n=1 Tax=Nocardioides gilvus TaxID=1735589 RepID=UPI000D745C0F|nr:CinA family protein [Nocardioides gilvus]